MTELIVAGFADTHSVFLARAALARVQQEELGMATEDVAMALRGSDGCVAVQQTLREDSRMHEASKFWEIMANLLFTFNSLEDDTSEEVLGACTRVGIDPASARLVSNQLVKCKSALLVRVSSSAQSEQVTGVLHGFRGELTQAQLKPPTGN